MNNCKTLICKNPKSKFKGFLKLNIPIGFTFYPDSENCYWPINSSLYELISDGWEIVK